MLQSIQQAMYMYNQHGRETVNHYTQSRTIRWMEYEVTCKIIFKVQYSDVRIQASRIRIRIRIQPSRIRIQLNPNPPLFSWIRIRIRIQLLWIRIRIRIQLDTEGPSRHQGESVYFFYQMHGTKLLIPNISLLASLFDSKRDIGYTFDIFVIYSGI